MNLHDADEYCRQKSAPAGSNFYYSILFYPEHLRRDLRALHALGVELEQIICECSDPGVMQIKFAWWQDEILRLYQNAARHPVSLALANIIARHNIQQHQLQEIIQNISRLATPAQATSRQEVPELFARGPGLLWQHSVRLCGHWEPEILRLASEMGGLFSRFHLLRQPVRPGTGFAAQCTSQEHGVLVQDIKNNLAHYYTVFPAAERRSLLHMLIMAQIISKTCETILRNDKIQMLTPLRKLWIAWQLQRRYRKQTGSVHEQRP